MENGHPLLYISYGMAKAGSTLAFHLTREIALGGGRAQPILPPGAVPEGARNNYMPVVRPVRVNAALEAVGHAGIGPVVIKTHSGLWKQTARLLEAGDIIGQAVCRDPRDLALSLLDAARTNGNWSTADGVPFQTFDDAMVLVRAHIAKFEDWSAQPNILVVRYEELAFDTETVGQRIADQMRVDADIPRAIDAAKARFTQFNKGVSRRHETDMSPETSAFYGREFADFIARWC